MSCTLIRPERISSSFCCIFVSMLLWLQSQESVLTTMSTGTTTARRITCLSVRRKTKASSTVTAVVWRRDRDAVHMARPRQRQRRTGTNDVLNDFFQLIALLSRCLPAGPAQSCVTSYPIPLSQRRIQNFSWERAGIFPHISDDLWLVITL